MKHPRNPLAPAAITALLAGLMASGASAQPEQLSEFQATHSELTAVGRSYAPEDVRPKVMPEPSGEVSFREIRERLQTKTADVGRAWTAVDGETRSGATAAFTMDLAFESIDLEDASTISGFFGTPPDTMGAVGPTQFFTAQNSAYRFHDKSTGAADNSLDVKDSDFWIAAVDPNDNGGGDPRVRFDRLRDRWVVIAFELAANSSLTNNRLLIAVSDGPDISASTVWTQYFIVPRFTVNGASNAGCFADYPTLGVDANAIYLGANMFPNTGTAGCDFGVGVDTAVFVIPVDQLPPAGGNVSAMTTAFTGLLQGDASEVVWTPTPADNYDPAAEFGYVVGANAFSDTLLRLGKITNPGGTAGGVDEPTMEWVDVVISNKNDGYDTGVPYPGVPSPNGSSTFGLDPLGFRPIGGAHIHDGHLWTTMTSSVDGPNGDLMLWPDTGDRHSVVFFEVDLATNILVQDGNVYDQTAPMGNDPMHVFMGNVSVNGQGHAAVGATGTRVSSLAPSGVWAARLATDPLGMFTEPEVYLLGSDTGDARQSFETGSGNTRWGDYAQVTVDPCDDMTFYAITQYQDAPAVATGGNWATGIARILAPAPTFLGAVPASSPPLASVLVTVTGTGFHSPPAVGMPPCRSDIDATTDHTGLVINSVDFVSSSQVQVDLDTRSALPGTATVVVANPDGQEIEFTIELSNDGLIFADGFESGDSATW